MARDVVDALLEHQEDLSPQLQIQVQLVRLM
jgi:hypothetical protein